MIDLNKFKNPPTEFRGVPFWSINDLLEEEKIRKEVRLLREAGYGGGFFHAREGLVTPFLSEEWFSSFGAAVDEAKKNNMYIWIYDELWWPSGFAGGIVTFKDKDYRAKSLVMVTDTRSYSGDDVIATFECDLDKNGIPVSYRKVKNVVSNSKKLYLTFLKYTAPIGEIWYNGSCYADLLNSKAVKYFLEVAYEPYVKRFNEDIGKTIPGVFTDEPNFSASRPSKPRILPPRGPRIPTFSVPWSNELPVKFKELNGYDLVDKLPELFFDVGNFRKTRYDFWKTVTLLFIESFSKQIYDWCSKNNLKFTGHYLCEDDLLSQMLCIGAAMPHYEFQHVPGIDHLGMQIWHGLLTAKQVSSVSNQLGKTRVLCEAYGTTGNYPTFEDRKWIGDWLLVMGINLLNHHLVPYSMRGRRKRDYGLNFHWGQPWWKYNKLIEDHFSRISYVLSQGKRVVKVLVIHPIGSAWALYSPLNDVGVRALDLQFRNLLNSLLKLHVDFDLGDEIIMQKYAKVENSKLKVGNMCYDLVIVPPSITLSSFTLDLLKKLHENGGKVVFVRPIPTLIDGKENEELKGFIEKCTVIPDNSITSVSKAVEGLEKDVVIEGDENGNLLYHLRKLEDGSLVLFIFNSSRESKVDAKVGILGSYSINLLNSITGEVNEFEGYEESNRTWFNYTFYPVSSLLLLLSPGKPKAKKEVYRLSSTIELNSGWKIRRTNDNVLVLDYCYYKVENNWSELLPLWKARREIVSKGIGITFTLKFEFESDLELKDRNVKLALETPEIFKIRINGKEVNWRDEGYWIDESIRTMRISEYLRKGNNEIELEGKVGMEPELENVFILGNFGVKQAPKGKSKIVEELEPNKISNLTDELYPFYVGSFEVTNEFTYRKKPGEKVFIRLEGLKAALAVVYVNEIEVGKVFAQPYSIEVTEFLKEGENKVKIELVGTLRNAFGPLHYEGGDPGWIGPEQFEDERHWTDNYVLKPLGMEKLVVETFEVSPS